jgi:hypothetical protein
MVTRPAVPGPGLDAAPEAALQSLLIGQQERLNSYGWIDREAGTVHIPIERAMSLLVEEGVAAQEGITPTFGLAPSFRLDSSGGSWLGGERDGAAPEEEAANE